MLTVTGGTLGYVFEIYKNNALVTVINSNDPVVYLSNLGAGSFSVKVTDNAGSIATGTW